MTKRLMPTVFTDSCLHFSKKHNDPRRELKLRKEKTRSRDTPGMITYIHNGWMKKQKHPRSFQVKMASLQREKISMEFTARQFPRVGGLTSIFLRVWYCI